MSWIFGNNARQGQIAAVRDSFPSARYVREKSELTLPFERSGHAYTLRVRNRASRRISCSGGAPVTDHVTTALSSGAANAACESRRARIIRSTSAHPERRMRVRQVLGAERFPHEWVNERNEVGGRRRSYMRSPRPS